MSRRLSRAGFKAEFIRPALLPDWWDDACSEDPSILSDIELRVARFLKLPISTIRDPSAALSPPPYSHAQLRRVRDIDRDRLGPAIHSAIQIAGAVVRSLRQPIPDTMVPPASGFEWRRSIESDGPAISLKHILKNLWQRGIPVVPIDVIPTPRFQGMACIVEGRPVILLGHKNDEPGRVAFVVAHETGHIAAGDCAEDQPVVDEDGELEDNALIEQQADRYATRVLIGSDDVPQLTNGNFKQLAAQAHNVERDTGAEASNVLFAWAAHTRDYAAATRAVQALYRGNGARQLLQEYFARYVDVDNATESDVALLRCVHGEPEHNAASD